MFEFRNYCIYNGPMTTTHSARGLVWIDMESPTEDEISSLVKRYELHPLVGEELKNTPSLPKADIEKDYILVVLVFPVRVKRNGIYTVVNQEVDFVIGRNYLITAHSDGIEQLEYFARIFETNAILNKDSKIENTCHLFYFMVKRLYAGMYDDIQNIRDALTKAEDQIFGGEERRMVKVLSGLSRELIDFRETVRVHREVWEDMVAFSGESLLTPEFRPYTRDIRDEFTRLAELLHNSRELVVDLRETNDSLLNARQNEIIKTLTLMAFMTFPLSLIAAVFTLPAENVPIIRGEYGWISILLIMLAVAGTLVWQFKKHKWI